MHGSTVPTCRRSRAARTHRGSALFMNSSGCFEWVQICFTAISELLWKVGVGVGCRALTPCVQELSSVLKVLTSCFLRMALPCNYLGMVRAAAAAVTP